MPIASSDIKFHLSGGAVNADPNAALSGAISTTQVVDATVANLFDNVSGAETAAGDTGYRCFYVKNNHGPLNPDRLVLARRDAADSVVIKVQGDTAA